MKIVIYFLFNIIFEYLNNIFLLNFSIFNLQIIQIKKNIGKKKAILFSKYSPYIIPIKYPYCTYKNWSFYFYHSDLYYINPPV